MPLSSRPPYRSVASPTAPQIRAPSTRSSRCSSTSSSAARCDDCVTAGGLATPRAAHLSGSMSRAAVSARGARFCVRCASTQRGSVAPSSYGIGTWFGSTSLRLVPRRHRAERSFLAAAHAPVDALHAPRGSARCAPGADATCGGFRVTALASRKWCSTSCSQSASSGLRSTCVRAQRGNALHAPIGIARLRSHFTFRCC